MEYQLIIFDADGTLADRDTRELLPGVARFFQYLAQLPPGERPQIAIATNQGGVGTRYWMESEGWGEPARFPTQEEIEAWYPELAKQLLPEIPHRLYIAYAYQDKRDRWVPTPPDQLDNPRWDQTWRKPSPGMLRQAMVDADVSSAQTLMVGDSEDDKLAAERAGVDFQWASDFFAPFTAQDNSQ
ncbi:MAG: HAD-IIIA family hydrolase [Chloroflexota bacterium]|nr:HAD-IIIA family hydrolase [Chloroflexota bacterium]